MKNLFKKINIKGRIRLYTKGWLMWFLGIGITSAICQLMRGWTTSDVHVPMIFVLAVLIISLSTDGYFYGILAAVFSVFAVNYAFTAPYFKLDFSPYGYPLTFITMLAVGLASSTLASAVKYQEKLRIEAEKEKVRSNLLRAISHDLRTPLTSISGSIGAVLDEEDIMDSAQRDELLLGAKQDAEWLCRMVENLLSITRISGDELQAIRKQDEAIEEVLGAAAAKFRQKHPEVTASVRVPDEPLFVPMDAMLIEQVLTNLMDNAVAHGETTTRISVSADTDGAFARITVEDNGVGIAPDIMKDLFNLPAKSGEREDKSRGMGIGLLVCRTIVEAHGGRIYAENSGSGARFVFLLQMGDSK